MQDSRHRQHAVTASSNRADRDGYRHSHSDRDGDRDIHIQLETETEEETETKTAAEMWLATHQALSSNRIFAC